MVEQVSSGLRHLCCDNGVCTLPSLCVLLSCALASEVWSAHSPLPSLVPGLPAAHCS